jgi:hypothetical protein
MKNGTCGRPSGPDLALDVIPVVGDFSNSVSASLPGTLRKLLENILSADLSNVRLHVGAQAERLNAAAFTLGSDIHFAPGFCRFDTREGLSLLGHELAHVLQQRSGRLLPHHAELAVVHDAELEWEADVLGSLIAAECLQTGQCAGAVASWRRSYRATGRSSTIQRRFFIGTKGYTSHDGNFDKLAQAIFPLAATTNLNEVTQALWRFDFQNRKFSNMVKFLSELNTSILLDRYEKATPVPKYLHHFWAGGALSQSAFANLQAWYARAEAGGWYQYILTDSVVNIAFDDKTLKHQLEVLTGIGSVVVDIAQLPFESKAVYEQLRRTVVEQKTKSKLPYLSDLARYAQLLALGGLYVDVDVSPGTVDMREVLLTLKGIPQLGPCLRTTADAKHLGFDTLESMRTVAMLAMFSKNKLAIGNHFIAAPARNPVVAKANEIATTQVSKHEITNGGLDFLKAVSRLDGFGTEAIQASLPAWIWDVVWVTPESDNTVD